MEKMHEENNLLSSEQEPKKDMEMPAFEDVQEKAEAEKINADLFEMKKEQAAEKAEILEKFQGERLGILGGAMERIKRAVEAAEEKTGVNKLKEKMNEKIPKPAQELISQMMDISSMKMYAEAGAGKSLVGKELTPKERILSMLSAGTNDIAKSMFAYAATAGSAEYASIGGALYGASWLFLLGKNGAQMMNNLKELASYYKLESVLSFLEKTEKIFNRQGYAELPKHISN